MSRRLLALSIQDHNTPDHIPDLKKIVENNVFCEHPFSLMAGENVTNDNALLEQDTVAKYSD